MALADIPFYGAYAARRQMNEQQPMQELQQASGAMGLMGAIQKQQQEQAFRADLAALGPNPGQEQLTALATKYATPHDVLATHQKSLDRATAAAGRPDNRPEILRLQDAAENMLPTDPRRAPIEARIKMLSERGEHGAPSPSPLGKLIAERDALPQGHPMRAVYDQAITKFQPGGIQVNVHPNAPLIPGKPAQNKVDEGLLDAGLRQQQLSSIERQFKPEYQEIGTKWDALKLDWQNKLGLGTLDPGQQRFLTEFSQFKRNSIDALNQYIKSVTGAAMTNAEAERILRGLPNPGTGLFDGDSPIAFKAKLDDAMKQVRMAEARLVHIKRNGLTLGEVPLERMPNLMNQRGGEIEAAIKRQQPTLKDDEVRKLVKRNLAQEFGLIE